MAAAHNRLWSRTPLPTQTLLPACASVVAEGPSLTAVTHTAVYRQYTPVVGCVEQVVEPLVPVGARAAGPVPTPAAWLPHFVPALWETGMFASSVSAWDAVSVLILWAGGLVGPKYSLNVKIPTKELGVPEEQVKRNSL